MKYIFLFFLITASFFTNGQTLSKMPDSVRKVVDEYTGVTGPAAVKSTKGVDYDRIVKEKLVKLALKNSPELTAADAQIEVANIARKKAKSTLLSTLNLGGNANEFVINNSPAANFFPKYNIGLTVPLDLFSRAKAEKQTAIQLIEINTAQRSITERGIRTKILLLYENYKEKKEIVELQKIAMEEDIAAYDKAQQDYAANLITLDQLNKVYKASVTEKSILASKQKDYNIAVIELEQMIGTSLESVLP